METGGISSSSLTELRKELKGLENELEAAKLIRTEEEEGPNTRHAVVGQHNKEIEKLNDKIQIVKSQIDTFNKK